MSRYPATEQPFQSNYPLNRNAMRPPLRDCLGADPNCPRDSRGTAQGIDNLVGNISHIMRIFQNHDVL